MMPLRRAQLIGAITLAFWHLSAGGAGGSEPDFFEKRIRPVLAEQCYECHSQVSGKARGGLRMDTRGGLLAGGDTGPAIAPGKPEESLLYRAITHRDPELAMPARKPKLAEPILRDFYQWIADGAPWSAGESGGSSEKKSAAIFDLAERKRRWPWIWETPRAQKLPSVKNRRWPASEPDFFILSRLEQNSLTPAPAADPRTWLRRVYFSIIGLPPSREEIHDFLEDTSLAGRAKVVDRLLASPHFGERWARHWLDLVRYAESRGHESDYPIANAYQYRDYVIRALNADVPYNQFTMEHVAGDLLQPPRYSSGPERNESVLATGWAFLGEEVHSPVDIRQDECERLDNKIDVFTKTFLGLTVACARCHDHKFDAISARDYYALSGYFLSSSYRQVRFESEKNNETVGRSLAILRQQSVSNIANAVAAQVRPGVDRLAEYLEASREVLQVTPDEKRPPAVETVAQNRSLEARRLRRWLGYLRTAAGNDSDPLCLLARAVTNINAATSESCLKELTLPGTAQATQFPADTRIILDYSRVSQPWRVDGQAFGSSPLCVGDICLDSESSNPIERIMPYGAARRDPFWGKLRAPSGNENDAGPLGATSRAGQMLCTPTFTLGNGKLHYLIRGKTRVYAAVDSHIMIEGPLHGRLVQVFDSGTGDVPRWFTHDLTPYSGHRVHVEFGPEGTNELELLAVVESDVAPTYVPGQSPWRPDVPVPSLRRLADQFQSELASACDSLDHAASNGTKSNAKQALLANWLVHHRDLLAPTEDASVAQAAKGFCEQLNRLEQQVQWESRTAVALFDGSGVDENILIRGKAVRPGPLAARGLPAAFCGTAVGPGSDSSGRYELARQLINPDNPLVARVMMNRVWHHLFGRGIVATVDNFGYLGERPSHPELLDQLAWSFVHEDGWSLKRLIKRLVLSSTFAMSSQSIDSRAEELDPANLLLHRMPVRRLEAEAIRDSLLVVSGRINPALGGPPVPVHLTEFVIGRGRPENSGPLDGDGRRSIYTAVRRNFLPTMMLAFDMPTPFSTVGRRNVTNVPAQSLALMNDPLFYEQARIWAERLLREQKNATPQARVQWLFETAYGRLPRPAETEACLGSLAELEKFQQGTPDELAVWADLCHAILNANDFIYLR